MVMGVKQFEKLFREAASLDIDKSDIKRLDDFVNERLHDLLLLAQSKAKANGRPVIDWIEITGGITVSLAKVFKTVDPHLKNPGTEEWEKIEQIYKILL